MDHVTHTRFRIEKIRLKKLAGLNQENKQVILLLHGPGGSGKSTVLDLLMLYAQEFCDTLGHTFTKRTIVVTAFSGVAATLIKGETIHSACYFNWKELTSDHREEWKDARMLIADEISFGSSMEYRKLDRNLRFLMGRQFANYGGLNIVFSGDFWQLDPVRITPIYQDVCPEFTDFINCYIELVGICCNLYPFRELTLIRDKHSAC